MTPGLSPNIKFFRYGCLVCNVTWMGGPVCWSCGAERGENGEGVIVGAQAIDPWNQESSSSRGPDYKTEANLLPWEE